VEIDEDLAAAARQRLADTGFGSIEVVAADGGFGYPARSPYDRIILTVGAWDIVPAWVEQLANNGRLVPPLSLRRVQKSVAFERRDHHLESVSVADCGFMRLRGAFAGPERIIHLGPAPGPYLSLDSDRVIDADGLIDALKGPTVVEPSGIEARLREVFGSLSLWLALADADSCSLGIYAEPSVVDRSPVPLLLEESSAYIKERSTLALLGKRGLVGLSRPAGGAADREASVALSVVSFGQELDLARRMRDHLAAWSAAGRPRTETLHIDAYPKADADLNLPGGSRVEKRWTTLVISHA
jgi:protein-L-isoaspartate(D-aspartate) O-methyltransferase